MNIIDAIHIIRDVLRPKFGADMAEDILRKAGESILWDARCATDMLIEAATICEKWANIFAGSEWTEPESFDMQKCAKALREKAKASE